MAVDRHGRAWSADRDPRRRPSDGFRAASATRFTRVVQSAASSLPRRLSQPLATATVVVEDVPPDPVLTVDGAVVLAVFGDGVLTVYRRPVEQRAASRSGLEETLYVAVGQAVARWLGDDPDAWLD